MYGSPGLASIIRNLLGGEVETGLRRWERSSTKSQLSSIARREVEIHVVKVGPSLPSEEKVQDGLVNREQ